MSNLNKTRHLRKIWNKNTITPDKMTLPESPLIGKPVFCRVRHKKCRANGDTFVCQTL